MTAAPSKPWSLFEAAGHLVALAEADTRSPRAPHEALVFPPDDATDEQLRAWLSSVDTSVKLPATRATWKALRDYLVALPDQVLREAWAALDVHLGVVARPATERWWLVGRLLRDAQHIGPAVRAWLVEASQGAAP